MNDMDYEDFLITIYRPLKAIEVLTDIAYEKGYCDWGLLSGNIERENADKLMRMGKKSKMTVFRTFSHPT